MSYTIEYNRQFIKTKNGYVPCILAGPSNVTEFVGKYERRVRSWFVFLSLIDKTEEEMLTEAKKCFNSYNQHWKKGSNWITNEGLLKWIKSGCRQAATLEDILEYNGIPNVHCYLSTIEWPNTNKLFEKFIADNETFEKWVQEVKKTKGIDNPNMYTAVIDFASEKIKSPPNDSAIKSRNKEINENDKFLLQAPVESYGYIYQILQEKYKVEFTPDITKAKVFTYKEIQDLIKVYNNQFGIIREKGLGLNAFKLVKAEKALECHYVIQFLDGELKNRYLGFKVKGNQYRIARDLESALKLTYKEAEKRVQDLKNKNKIKVRIEIVDLLQKGDFENA